MRFKIQAITRTELLSEERSYRKTIIAFEYPTLGIQNLAVDPEWSKDLKVGDVIEIRKIEGVP